MSGIGGMSGQASGIEADTAVSAPIAWPSEEQALTPAELKVVQGFVRGWSYKEIAARRCIRGETVKSHVKRTLGKARCANRMQLVLLVLCLSHELRRGTAS